jgi:hypothetical protein
MMAGENINNPLDLNKFFISGGGSSGSAAKDLNYQQDLLSYLMSASTGIGTGTYDPMLAVPPEYFPPATTYLDSFERSPSPILSAVARKIRAGLIDPASAVAEIATQLNVTESMSNAGFDMKSIRDNVSAMFAEVTSTIEAENKHFASVKDWETTNQYGKAGFSQPYEQYTMQTLPFSSNVQDKQSQLDWLRRESEMNREKVQPKFESDLKSIYEKMLSEANFLSGDESNVKSDFSKEKMGWIGAGESNMVGDAGPTIATYNRSTGLAPVKDVPAIAESNRSTGIKSDTSSKKSTAKQDQNARLGIALSYKAAEQARAKNPLDQNKDERDKLSRQLMIAKMAELAAAEYLGRTPFSDQFSQRISSL